MKSKQTHLVFVVENDHLQENRFRENFQLNQGYTFVYFKSSGACLEQLHLHPMAVLIDHDLRSFNRNQKDAITILEKIRELDHNTEVVFFSKEENQEVARDMVEHGAFDYVVVNNNSLLRLQKTLSNIKTLLRQKKKTAQYRLWVWVALILYTAFVACVAVMYFKD